MSNTHESNNAHAVGHDENRPNIVPDTGGEPVTGQAGHEPAVAYQRHGGLVWLIFGAADGNLFDETLLDTLHAALTRFVADPTSHLAILCGKGDDFSRGAAPEELGTLYNSDAARPLCETLQASPKPVVALLRGAVLGTALEIALACSYRLAVGPVRMGFPEIHLGLPPGAGATVRLPRLIDNLDRSARLLLSGASINATVAMRWGLLDHRLSRDDQDEIEAVLHNLPAHGRETAMNRPSPAGALADMAAWPVRHMAQQAIRTVLSEPDAATADALERQHYRQCEESTERHTIAAHWQTEVIAAQRPLNGVALPVIDRIVLLGGHDIDASLVLPEVVRTETVATCIAEAARSTIIVVDQDPICPEQIEKLDQSLPTDQPLLVLRPETESPLIGNARLIDIALSGGHPRRVAMLGPSESEDQPHLAPAVAALRALGLPCLHLQQRQPLGAILIDATTDTLIRTAAAIGTNRGLHRAWRAVGPAVALQQLRPDTDSSPATPPLPWKRLVYLALLNNALRCLAGEWNLARHPDDLDLLLIEGFNLDVTQGGILRQSLIEPETCLRDITNLAQRYGEPWRPAKLWQRIERGTADGR
ncbi:enoyl-CoA hydratase/isomerase family protein [Salinisphaera sp. Q1T1-3]|uniref:enoyl-CoA hydratase/isomerase family protein n=1 Tax=Salinisphaera sp. Q1T1-3 TaxID=2321229 RepID=UPI000E770309|nr:enoyl-CoA hydratase/isomerase family protein [Salinisphaera sp. Q1T1-3]RJS93725.1 enoyl-CoA hydratase/isomerase family protein [Salinisphaera sp. Q1T1-3]